GRLCQDARDGRRNAEPGGDAEARAADAGRAAAGPARRAGCPGIASDHARPARSRTQTVRRSAASRPRWQAAGPARLSRLGEEEVSHSIPTTAVIPGRREAANPESITTNL